MLSCVGKRQCSIWSIFVWTMTYLYDPFVANKNSLWHDSQIGSWHRNVTCRTEMRGDNKYLWLTIQIHKVANIDTKYWQWFMCSFLKDKGFVHYLWEYNCKWGFSTDFCKYAYTRIFTTNGYANQLKIPIILKGSYESWTIAYIYE